MATSDSPTPIVNSGLLVTVVEFDYQWTKLPDPNLEYTETRVSELLDYTGLKRKFFVGKSCLDVGCGTGRWSWAMLRMGAHVDGFDISHEAVNRCKSVNPAAYVFDLMELKPSHKYDFVLCWGVLHHLADPRRGFQRVATQVKIGGTLHVMVYHLDTQKQYEEGRRLWPRLSHEQRIAYCTEMARKTGENVHGWWDALNPKFNFSFEPSEVEGWFKQEGFAHVTLTKRYNINMRGVYSPH